MKQITEREFLSFMIGSLSGTGLPDEKKSMVLHKLADQMKFPHSEASELLHSLSEHSRWYLDNKVGNKK